MTDPDKPSEHPRKGFLLALAGTFFVSTYFVTGKYAVTGFGVPTFSLLWGVSGAFFALTISLVRGHARALRVSRRQIPILAALGATTGVGMILLWTALDMLDASFLSFLERSMPVFVILMGVIFLKERLRAVELLPIVVMLVGGVVSVWGRWEIVGKGVIVGVAGYVAFALQRFFAKLGGRQIPAEVLVFYRTGLATIAVSVWAFSTRKVAFDVDARYWTALLGGALFSSCIGNMFTFAAFRHWSLSRATMVSMIQPLLVLAMAVAFLGKLPAAQELVGGMLILAGAAGLVWIHFFAAKGGARNPENNHG